MNFSVAIAANKNTFIEFLFDLLKCKRPAGAELKLLLRWIYVVKVQRTQIVVVAADDTSSAKIIDSKLFVIFLSLMTAKIEAVLASCIMFIISV